MLVCSRLHRSISRWCVLKVLSIGETVMEVNDSGFSGTVETLRIQLLVDDSMLQVPFLACTSTTICLCSYCLCASLLHGCNCACRCTPRVCGIYVLTGE